MKLEQFSLKNPAAIAAGALLVLLFGWIALARLPIQLLPDTRQPQLFINVGWREAAPSEVEEALIEPIEEAMRGLPGLTEMRANAGRGNGGVNLIFALGTDMTRVMLDVVSRLNTLPALPPDADEPQVFAGDNWQGQNAASMLVRPLPGNPNLDMVFGYQEKRKGGFIEKNFGNLFYKVFNLFSEIKIPENILTERLMSKKYVQELAALPDKNIFFAGLMQWVGFNQLGIPIKKQNRKGGSTYTFRKRINLMINAITSFTAYPLKILFNLGVLISMGSVVASLILIARKIIQPERILSGYTSLTVVILLSTGLILTAIGVLGIYLEKIFNQVKNRPTFIIKKIHDYEQN